MDSLWSSSPSPLSWVPLAANSYFNISLAFILKSCQPGQPLSNTESEIMEEKGSASLNKQEMESDTEVESFSLNEALSWLLGSGWREHKEGEEEEKQGVQSYGSSAWWGEKPLSEDCQNWIYTDFDVSFLYSSALKIMFGFLLTVFISRIILSVLWRKLADCRTKTTTLDTGKENRDALKNKDQAEGNDAGATEGACPKQGVGSVVTIGTVAGAAPKLPLVIMLGSACNHSGGRGGTLSSDGVDSFAVQTDSWQFLQHTVDFLSYTLDWILGVGLGVRGAPDSSSPTSSLSLTASSLLTPRLQRKNSNSSVIRRPRWGRTLTSIPSPPGLAASADCPAPDNKATTLRFTGKIGEMGLRMGWTPPQDRDLEFDLDRAKHDLGLSCVLQFYQQTCPVPVEQWAASTTMVQYLLTLLDLELTSTTSVLGPLKFVELCGFGSTSAATCVGRADRFNILLVVRLSACSEMTVYDCETCDDIPAGRLVLGVKEGGGGWGNSSLLIRKDRVGDCFGSFLSASEVTKACQRILTSSLDRLRLKHKGLLDHLPFSFHLDPYTDLLLRLDTRLLNGVGLGISEIRISFTPAMRICHEGYHPLPSLYAVPPWKSKASNGSVKSRAQSGIILRNQGVASDLLWQLNGFEVTQAFMASAKRRLEEAGVAHGCQLMCQQLLRAAFSSSGKGSLLTAGELPPYVLDTVVLFLLLESPPSSWRLSCLSDRFSDCIHFLRSAVQSCWMPGFIPHNPHLHKAMPALQLLPLIGAGRQENLLAGVGLEEAETMLSFVDSRLTETGLRRSVKEDYSAEMWEYEFFIFG